MTDTNDDLENTFIIILGTSIMTEIQTCDRNSNSFNKISFEYMKE